jgi:hypothetical protein
VGDYIHAGEVRLLFVMRLVTLYDVMVLVVLVMVLCCNLMEY